MYAKIFVSRVLLQTVFRLRNKSMMCNSKRISEFNVPVPWGYIAVKAWGDENDEAILVSHGRLDNAGAFDRLIPYLPNSFYYICIDLPGHGKSSHFSPHLPIYTTNYVLVYKLLAQYFKRQSYIIMGHSYGGQIGFLFAQLYPNLVKKLILLDTVHMYPVSVKDFKYYLIDSFNSTIKLTEKLKTGNPPSYTYEEALNKLLHGRQGTPLTTEAATALLRRAVEPTGDGKYTFTFDQRMKNFINPTHDFRYILEALREDPVTCPILIVLGEHSFTKIDMELILQELSKLSNVSVEYVDGYHDIHNNNPDRVAPIVNKFLITQKGKL
ncbi:serine hydrolase-like protein [Anoplophora glabripennis]|nr:serine hydrolase-like protein [Anoplophora glabripennis]